MKTLKHKSLEWAEPSKEPMSWDKSSEYCESLGNGWRLPTINELQSIISYKRREPAIKKKFIKNFSDVVSYYYWSSTTDIYSTSYVWSVGIGDGSIGVEVKSNSFYVLPVRDIEDTLLVCDICNRHKSAHSLNQFSGIINGQHSKHIHVCNHCVGTHGLDNKINFDELIKSVDIIYGVVDPGYRTPCQFHHSLERLKKVNEHRVGYKIVEYKLNES